jgi:hypothetical protein
LAVLWPKSGARAINENIIRRKTVTKFAVSLFVVLLAVTVSVPVVSAQDNMGANKQEMAAKLEKISSALQLTPQQKQQLRPILMEEAPKLKAVKDNTSLGPLQKGMQLRQIGEATDAKVMPILNPEQQQKWTAMRQQEREQMMQKMENRQ